MPDPVVQHAPSTPVAPGSGALWRDPDPLLDGLDEGQQDAVTTEAAPLAILAGPGSGKTRVLTRRIAWQARAGRIDAEHVLAVTFTRKAAGELTRRLRPLGVAGVTAGTLHSVALGQLQRRAVDQGRTLPTLLEHKVRLLAGLVGGTRPEAWAVAPEVAREIEWAKASLVDPDRYPDAATRAGRTPPRSAAETAEFYRRYEEQLRRRHLADFDDLLGHCADALEEDAAFAAAARWHLRHLFVDEFQDVSPLQLRLLRAWLGDRQDLCVVGDPDQSIYAFAGAEAGYLRGFVRLFPGASTVRLERNYRSSPEILGAAEAVLADADPRRRPRTAVRPSGPAPTVTGYADDEAEAAGVSAALPEIRATFGTWAAAAVLYRTNAQSVRFEEQLARDGIPFRVVGDGRFLDRPEVKAAIDTLRRAARNAPGRDLGDLLAALEEDAAALSEERREHVSTLVGLGQEFREAGGGAATLDGFLTHLTTTLRRDPPDTDRDGVQLLTFHRAKGLEFPVVFVTGLERGFVPIAHADTPGARAEERRLLYVALSRAEDRLHLTYARQRTLGSRRVPRARSPWLTVIAPTAAAPEARTRSTTAPSATALTRTREALATRQGEDDDRDPELLAALKTWRRNLARASGVPAYVIFPDTTLDAVARVKPTQPSALLALPGVGPVKAERHGDAVLDLVRQHAG